MRRNINQQIHNILHRHIKNHLMACLVLCGLIACESPLTQAHKLLEDQDYAKADQVLTRFLEDEPSHVEAHALRAQAWFFNEKPLEAFQELKSITKQSPDNGVIKQSAIQIAKELRRYDDMVAMDGDSAQLEAYIQHAPNRYLRERAELALTNQWFQSGKKEQAHPLNERLEKSPDPIVRQLALWQKARYLSPKYYSPLITQYPNSPLLPQWYMEQIRQAEQQKDTATTNLLLLKLKADARDQKLKSEVLRLQGKYNIDNNPVAALNYFKTFLERSPKHHPQIRTTIYSMREKLGKYLTETDHRFLAKIAMENWMYQTAYAELATLSHPTVEERYQLGWCALKGRMYPQAGAAFSQLIQAFPNTSEAGKARVNQVTMLRYSKKYEEALKQLATLKEAYASNSSILGYILREEGRVYDYMNQFSKEAHAYRQLLMVSPEHEYLSEALWHVIWEHFIRKEYDAVIQMAEKHMAAIPEEERSRFEYWVARAEDKSGKAKLAQQGYERLSHRTLTDYYTHLAINQLNQQKTGFSNAEYKGFKHTSASENDVTLSADFNTFMNSDKSVTFTELNHLLYLHQYEDFVDATTFNDNDRLQVLRGNALYHLGKYNQAIRQYRYEAETHPELLPVAYPLVYFDTIEKEATRYGMSPFLVAGLIWQESQYEPTARSWVGATGLMQIMPGTAQTIADKMGIQDYQLTDPATCIRMGSWYLNFTRESFDGNLLFAVASYNAGRGPVYRWQKEFEGYEMDELAESITYPETQDYVKKVFTSYGIYRYLYGK